MTDERLQEIALRLANIAPDEIKGDLGELYREIHRLRALLGERNPEAERGSS